jgi:hypothetical protein
VLVDYLDGFKKRRVKNFTVKQSKAMLYSGMETLEETWPSSLCKSQGSSKLGRNQL